MSLNSAPGLCRIYRRLLDHGQATSYELAEACHVVKRHAQWSLNRLHEVGLARIVGWRKQFGEGARGRPYFAVWAYGPGSHAAKPEHETANASQLRRARRIKMQYGDLAGRVLSSRANGGADRIVVDGVVIYQRSVPRGRRVAA